MYISSTNADVPTIVVPEDTYSQRFVMSMKSNTGYKINNGEEWHTKTFFGVITHNFLL
jgi:hypothetical protein